MFGVWEQVSVLRPSSDRSSGGLQRRQQAQEFGACAQGPSWALPLAVGVLVQGDP